MKVQRTFIPGSEWLYYKVYAGPKTIERFLLNEVSTIVNELRRLQIIDKYFFIKYTDPDYHLRLRFHLKDISYYTTILQQMQHLFQPYVESKIVWKFCVDTYSRELERYGHKTISDAETIFFNQSDAALHIMKITPNEFDPRWAWSMKYMDMTLDQFGFDLKRKLNFFHRLSNGFLKEVNYNKWVKINLGLKCRESKSTMERIMEDNEFNNSSISLIKNTITDSNESINNILAIYGKEEGANDLNNLLSSFFHMANNRIFRTEQRLYELVLYYFLSRYYSSKVARLKYA